MRIATVAFLICALVTNCCIAASDDFFNYQNEKQKNIGFGYIKNFDPDSSRLITTKYYMKLEVAGVKFESIGKIKSSISGSLVSIAQTSYVNKKLIDKYEIIVEKEKFLFKGKKNFDKAFKDPIVASIVGATNSFFKIKKKIEILSETTGDVESCSATEMNLSNGCREVNILCASGLGQVWSYLSDGSLKSISIKKSGAILVASRLNQKKEKAPENPLKNFFDKND